MAIDGIAPILPGIPEVPSRPVGGKSAPAPPASDVQEPKDAARQPVSVELPDLEINLDSINESLRDSQCDLSFSVDEGTGKTVVLVYQKSTGRVIRQIPSEEVLAIAAILKRGDSPVSLGIDEHS